MASAPKPGTSQQVVEQVESAAVRRIVSGRCARDIVRRIVGRPIEPVAGELSKPGA